MYILVSVFQEHAAGAQLAMIGVSLLGYLSRTATGEVILFQAFLINHYGYGYLSVYRRKRCAGRVISKDVGIW